MCVAEQEAEAAFLVFFPGYWASSNTQGGCSASLLRLLIQCYLCWHSWRPKFPCCFSPADMAFTSTQVGTHGFLAISRWWQAESLCWCMGLRALLLPAASPGGWHGLHQHTGPGSTRGVGTTLLLRCCSLEFSRASAGATLLPYCFPPTAGRAFASALGWGLHCFLQLFSRGRQDLNQCTGSGGCIAFWLLLHSVWQDLS